MPCGQRGAPGFMPLMVFIFIACASVIGQNTQYVLGHLDLVTGDTHTIHFAHYVSKLSMFYERDVDITSACHLDLVTGDMHIRYTSHTMYPSFHATGFSLRLKQLALVSRFARNGLPMPCGQRGAPGFIPLTVCVPSTAV